MNEDLEVKKKDLEYKITYWKDIEGKNFEYLKQYTKEELIAISFDVNQEYKDLKSSIETLRTLINEI